MDIPSQKGSNKSANTHRQIPVECRGLFWFVCPQKSKRHQGFPLKIAIEKYHGSIVIEKTPKLVFKENMARHSAVNIRRICMRPFFWGSKLVVEPKFSWARLERRQRIGGSLSFQGNFVTQLTGNPQESDLPVLSKENLLVLRKHIKKHESTRTCPFFNGGCTNISIICIMNNENICNVHVHKRIK